jgi:membrane protease YdiL (CAAX protease family)
MNPEMFPHPGSSSFLRPFWSRVVGPPWLVSLLALLLLGAARLYAFLGPPHAEPLYLLYCAIAGALPYILLTPQGRRQIGLRGKGMSASAMGLGALAGVCCALAVYFIGMGLYGDSPNNWSVSVRDFLRLGDMGALMSPATIFALYAVPALLLTPIGEEFLFRGILQESFTRRWNAPTATLIGSLAWSLVYLHIHAIWQDAAGFHFRLVSGLLSIFLLACVGVVFILCRMLSGSLWPAMAAHAGFNLTFNAAIIFHFVR